VDTQCILVPDHVYLDVPLQVLVCHAEVEGRSRPPGDSFGAHPSSSLSDTAESAMPVPADSAPHSASYPSLLVLLGRGARLELLQSHHTILLPSPEEPLAPMKGAQASSLLGDEESKAFVAATTRLVLAEGAAMIHSYLQEAAGE
jgi:hypothetical protein